MTKKKQEPANEFVDLINVDLDVPPNTAKKFGIEQLNLQLNAPVIEYARRFMDELKMARRLPNEPEDITLSDPLAIWILGTESDLDGSAVLRKAEYHYRNFINEANREAFILAMTMFNEFDKNIAPTPYRDNDRTALLQGKGGVPAWLAEIPEVPEPARNLDHRYERRLKVTMDLLEQGGQEDPFFLAQFNRVINNDLVAKMREMGVNVGEPTDEDGFHEDAASS